MTDETYNGWTNYATWGVALVLDNDQGTQEWVQGLAKRSRACAEAYLADPDNAGSVLNADDLTRQQLADDLKDYTEELCGLEGFEGGNGEPLSLMARQVIQAGLSEVSWDEIARNVLDES